MTGPRAHKFRRGWSAPLLVATVLLSGVGFLLIQQFHSGEINGLKQEVINAKDDTARLQAEVDRYKALQERMQIIDESFTEQKVKELEEGRENGCTCFRP